MKPTKRTRKPRAEGEIVHTASGDWVVTCIIRGSMFGRPVIDRDSHDLQQIPVREEP